MTHPLLSAALLAATVAIASGCATCRPCRYGYDVVKTPSAQERARINRLLDVPQDNTDHNVRLSAGVPGRIADTEKIIDGRVPQRAEGTCTTDGPKPCEMPTVREGWEAGP